MSSLYDRMTVDLPEGSEGRYHIRQFTVTRSSSVRAQVGSGMVGRPLPPGTYTKLVVGDDPDDPYSSCRLWMSDTPAEKRDHTLALMRIQDTGAERVLINGLGLGMVLAAALSFDHVRHVDVVETNEDVINLVGPTYLKDPRVNIIHADAYDQAKAWPTGTRWDVGWSDIWMDIDTGDLAGHARLNRSYGRRCGWHGCWVHDLLLYKRSLEREEQKRYESWHS